MAGRNREPGDDQPTDGVAVPDEDLVAETLEAVGAAIAEALTGKDTSRIPPKNPAEAEPQGEPAGEPPAGRVTIPVDDDDTPVP
jgi:hypothetical protein